jgi:hypothetical protein
MANTSGHKSYIWEEPCIEFVSSFGYDGIVNYLRVDISCELCPVPTTIFTNDKDFKAHIENYHRVEFETFLKFKSLDYPKIQRKFWCPMCVAVKTAAFADGGRDAHIADEHDMDKREFDNIARAEEQIALAKIVNRRICYVKMY